MSKVVIRKPHYLDGVYYDASPESPKTLELKDHWGADKNPDMEVVDDDAEVKGVKLGRHFNDKAAPHVQSSAQVHSEPKPTKRS